MTLCRDSGMRCNNHLMAHGMGVPPNRPARLSLEYAYRDGQGSSRATRRLLKGLRRKLRQDYTLCAFIGLFHEPVYISRGDSPVMPKSATVLQRLRAR